MSIRRFTHLVIAVPTLAWACAHPAATPPTATPALRFVLVNDVYVTDTLADGTAGVARLPTLRAREAAGGPTLFVLAGDVLSPSLLSKWYSGRQMIEAFNAAGLDVVTFGNHEWELDRDTLVARIRASKFRWTSANCMEANGHSFPGVSPWDTVTIGGVRIGYFGLTLRGPYRRYVTCTDPDSAAHAAIATLRAAGAQLIVAITHQALAQDSALLAREPMLALILGGHEHEWHHVAVGERLVVKADANARTAQIVTVTRNGDDGWRYVAKLDTLDRRLKADSTTAAVVRRWQDSLRHRLGPERVVATATAPIDARDVVGRRQESALGDLVTDAMRAGTGADVALINAGAMRIDDVILAGPVSNYQIESIFLFADETRVIVFPITGARLRAVLEHGVSDGAYGAGGFLQVSGIRFAYDSARASGARLVGDVRRADGRVIAPSDTVRVAFDGYPACEGGDGFTVPEAAPTCGAVQRGPRTVDLVEQYIANTLHGTITPSTEGRITRQ